MDTTTQDEGAIQAQPIESGAEAAEVQSQPTEEQSASQPQDQPNESSADSEQPQEEAQEESQADDVKEWAEKKGLPLDDPIKLAQMYRDAEKKMHEVTQTQKSQVQPPEPLELTGDINYDAIVERQNQQELRTYVRDWFDANPEMKQHRDDLMKIANERPWLQNLDDIKAHYLADPSRLQSIKTEGGRQALTNLAQKQQQSPPNASATNANSYASSKITPQNVDQMVANMTPEEYQKRLPEINAALQG